MTANEWLGVMKQAQDFPKGMEKLIVKYGEMLIAEHESKVKKLTIPDVSNSAGYSSFEVCFTAKLQRKGIMKWLENKGIIKERTEGFAVMVRDINDVDYISSVEKEGVCILKNFKVNGLR